MSHIDVKMRAVGSEPIPAKISVMNNLIMLHSDHISAQWPLDHTGVELTHQGNGIIKLGFHHTGCATQTYQSFYFDARYHEVIHLFFKTYGFPMYKAMYDDAIKLYKSEPTDTGADDETAVK